MSIYISEVLEKFAVNMNVQAQQGKFDPVILRELEIRNVLEVLCRKNKNNPMLVGKPGVGKTAIVEGIAELLVKNDLPEILKNRVIYNLKMSDLIAGTSYRGEFEERLTIILNEVKKNSDKIFLYIDEIHNTIGTGAVRGSLDVANILKPAISRGEIHLIGSTTDSEYHQFIESDKAFERRFQKVTVEEPDEKTATQMLLQSKERYENHHGLSISKDAIRMAVSLSAQLIPDRYLPDKALDLIDLAAANIRLDMESIPRQLIELNQRISRIELEIDFFEGNTTHNDQARTKLMVEKSVLLAERDKIKSTWIKEKAIILEEKYLKRVINTYKKEAKENEKIGYQSKSEEINGVLIPALEKKIKALMKELDASGALIYRNEVMSSDIERILSMYFPKNHVTNQHSI